MLCCHTYRWATSGQLFVWGWIQDFEEALGESGKEPPWRQPQDLAWLSMRNGLRNPWEPAPLPRRIWIWGDQQPQWLHPVIRCSCSAVAPGTYQGNAAWVALKANFKNQQFRQHSPRDSLLPGSQRTFYNIVLDFFQRTMPFGKFSQTGPS